MAARTTEADVLKIIPETSVTDMTIQILCANGLTNRLAASSCGSSLTDDELFCIETYLAAHFVALADPTLLLTKEKVEDSESTFSRGNTASKSGVMSTTYGQAANTMSNGCLQELESKKPSLFSV